MPFPRQTMHEGEVLQLSVREPNVPTLEHLRLLIGKTNIRKSMINKDLPLTLVMLLTMFSDGLTKLNIFPQHSWVPQLLPFLKDVHITYYVTEIFM